MQKQSLELCDRFFSEVVGGDKRQTLRFNEGDITEGYLEFFGSDTPDLRVLVYVTEVTNAPLSSFAEYYETTPEILLEQMRSHYDDIQLDSIVSLINHLCPTQTQTKLKAAQKAGDNITIIGNVT